MPPADFSRQMEVAAAPAARELLCSLQLPQALPPLPRCKGGVDACYPYPYEVTGIPQRQLTCLRRPGWSGAWCAHTAAVSQRSQTDSPP